MSRYISIIYTLDCSKNISNTVKTMQKREVQLNFIIERVRNKRPLFNLTFTK